MMGCYRSIRDNQSDFTPLPVRYPIKNFDRVKPVQVFFETPVSVLSTYKVDDKFTTIYADLLKDSLKSFDLTVWSAVVSVLFIFVGLLVLRWLLNSLKNDNKEMTWKIRHSLRPSVTWLVKYLLISLTDLERIFIHHDTWIFLNLGLLFEPDVNWLGCRKKPPVIQNYRDIMDKENYTVGLLAGIRMSKNSRMLKQEASKMSFGEGWKTVY